MNSGYNSMGNSLDRIRRSQGVDACKSMFGRLGKEHKQNAVRLVNDGSLFFASLFILQPEIEELNLKEELSERNRIALSLCKKILDNKGTSESADRMISLNSEEVHHVLLWMFNTGAADDGLNNDFDQVLDIVASVLMKTHHEKTILPVMTNMIFKRNQRGHYIHDLVWACFQTHDANALRLIAGYLRSPVAKDVDLAHTLLHLPQEMPSSSFPDRQKQYVSYLSWLKENEPYLYFTGESLQFTNNPTPCGVDLEAKYLCKDGGMRGRKQPAPLTDTERDSLTKFNRISEEEKKALAKHSQKLHRENPSYWSEWMQYPIDKQVNVAQYGRRKPK